MKRNFLVILMATVFGFTLMSCSRSPRYYKEKQYFETAGTQDQDEKEEKINLIERFGAPKKRIYVLPFYNGTPYDKREGKSSDDLGSYGAKVLMREVRNTGKAIVPDNLVTTAHSRDFFIGEKVRVSSLVKEARKLNVAIVVVGRILRIRYRQKGDPMGLLRKHHSRALVDVEIRVFDVVEGKEFYSESKVVESSSSKMDIFNRQDDMADTQELKKELIEEALSNGAVLFAKSMGKALEKVAWEGRIAKIEGNLVYVNAGKSSGINIGDILKVVSPGEDLIDPVTGSFMGRSKGHVKGTLEVTEYLGTDGSVTKIHSGGGFIQNDSVQLY